MEARLNLPKSHQWPLGTRQVAPSGHRRCKLNNIGLAAGADKGVSSCDRYRGRAKNRPWPKAGMQRSIALRGTDFVRMTRHNIRIFQQDLPDRELQTGRLDRQPDCPF
jgi:hypothetical protein